MQLFIKSILNCKLWYLVWWFFNIYDILWLIKYFSPFVDYTFVFPFWVYRITLSRREKDWSVSSELLVITQHIICHISAEERTVRKKREMQIRIATRRFRHRDAQPEYCTSHGCISQCNVAYRYEETKTKNHNASDCHQRQIRSQKIKTPRIIYK